MLHDPLHDAEIVEMAKNDAIKMMIGRT